MYNNVIDFVIPWVDPSDKEWQLQHRRCAEELGKTVVFDDSESRYRDWDTLRYLFRGIEKFTPWVRKVHFITCGHLPKWMNTKAEKLHIVKHTDYMDSRYLPTFSSHTIELNMHRISDLAEQFVYFNDDILLLRPMKPEDFFKNGKPRDYAILNPAISSHRYSVLDTAITDIEIINDYFSKNRVIAKHPFKWFNIRYGVNNLKTLALMPWPRFAHLYGRHLCNSFLKSTFEELWKKEYSVLDETSSHKFRTRRDVNQWLMREWQLAKGCFEPISPNRGKYFVLKDDNTELLNTIRSGKYAVICANDVSGTVVGDFEIQKNMLTDELDRQLSMKSQFES